MVVVVGAAVGGGVVVEVVVAVSFLLNYFVLSLTLVVRDLAPAER